MGDIYQKMEPMDNMVEGTEPEELFDEELRALGIPFTDETVRRHNDRQAGEESEGFCRDKTIGGKKYAAMHEAGAARSIYDRMLGCIKWVLAFGALGVLFFYWQETGQMMPTAALPCMCACSLLAGFGSGKYLTK